MTVALAPQLEGQRVAPAKPAATPVALSYFERRAVTALVDGDATELEQYASERAAAYATGDAAVRRRALARAAAVADVLVQELTALLTAAVGRRDERGAHLLDRTLNSANARLLRLLEQLRVESAPTRRVLMRASGEITVAAEERG